MDRKTQSASHRGTKSLKLIGSVRGAGVFIADGPEVAVRYQLDSFEEKHHRTIGGSLDGDVSFAADRTPGVLRLASGEEVNIVLIKPDEDGADFQAG